MALSKEDSEKIYRWLEEQRRAVEVQAGYGNWYQTEGALEMIRQCMDKLKEVGYGSD